MKTGVLGSGSWGTAIVKTIFDKGQDEVYWWLRQQKNYEYVLRYGRNARYLRSVDIDLKPKYLSTEIQYIISESEVLIFCVPSMFLKTILKDVDKNSIKDKIVVSAIKGTTDGQLISSFFEKEYGIDSSHFIFLTGPSHAEEVVNNMKTYLTLASFSEENSLILKKILENEFIECNISKDVKGLQYTSALKNIYAIAAGVCRGLGYGDNFISVLIANAIREISLLVDSCCPCNRNMFDSAYLGDLMVTCFSQFSRNRTFGEMIGHGYSVQTALLELNMIPEGYFAIKHFYSFSKELKTEMKILTAVNEIFFENADVHTEILKLENSIS